MIHLITGGSGSGKSRYAEQQIEELGDGPRIYLATMASKDEESRKRIKKHQDRRRGMNFTTIEKPTKLMEVEVPEGSSVLLECVSNLLANEMFMPGQSGIHSVNAVIDGIEHIDRQCANLVIVTNEVFSDGVQYGNTTHIYMEFLGLINQHLGRMSDLVTEVVYGIPIPVKRPGHPELSL
ncbi:MAG: bifunctional adenosylcobinamide kinase/adenosylcobinamide-phosphate guanylyltransferase [Lachnospiraceae bacterium]|nr:bifunctional adenosylcobinamide kinase/adenosylcobinamide-phosphate guanylyltransferase [Lachnospiraceae bacterium]MCI1328965.1 bifunctional adenosylcobinamide kinase/adenosylcobinamide-phosphate guanylyltransferase [Lachnospiraceae bacterium]